MVLVDGKIDGLFNNAAFGQPGAVEDLSREVLRNQFETNVFGTHELTNLIIPIMRQQGHGRIIYNSSVLGFVAMRYRGAYNASKFALEGLVDTLRIELHGTNIKLSLVEPGPIESHFRKMPMLYLKPISISHPVPILIPIKLWKIVCKKKALPYLLPYLQRLLPRKSYMHWSLVSQRYGIT